MVRLVVSLSCNVKSVQKIIIGHLCIPPPPRRWCQVGWQLQVTDGGVDGATPIGPQGVDAHGQKGHELTHFDALLPAGGRKKKRKEWLAQEDRQANMLPYKQADRETGDHTNRQTGKQTNIYIIINPPGGSR
jgi:hypothetical protein